MLDSSSSIGVTERTAYILRVRQLAVGIAKAYVGRAARPPSRSQARLSVMDRELLLEIGCEELPASWLPGLTNQIGDVRRGAARERIACRPRRRSRPTARRGG